MWVKLFKNGPICVRQPLKNLNLYGLPHLKFFEGCFPQILLGSFLNNLFHM